MHFYTKKDKITNYNSQLQASKATINNKWKTKP